MLNSSRLGTFESRVKLQGNCSGVSDFSGTLEYAVLSANYSSSTFSYSDFEGVYTPDEQNNTPQPYFAWSSCCIQSNRVCWEKLPYPPAT